MEGITGGDAGVCSCLRTDCRYRGVVCMPGIPMRRRNVETFEKSLGLGFKAAGGNLSFIWPRKGSQFDSSAGWRDDDLEADRL